MLFETIELPFGSASRHRDTRHIAGSTGHGRGRATALALQATRCLGAGKTLWVLAEGLCEAFGDSADQGRGTGAVESGCIMHIATAAS
eukprot:14498302-Heterocapsa_arctica.AAC.1